MGSVCSCLQKNEDPATFITKKEESNGEKIEPAKNKRSMAEEIMATSHFEMSEKRQQHFLNKDNLDFLIFIQSVFRGIKAREAYEAMAIEAATADPDDEYKVVD